MIKFNSALSILLISATLLDLSAAQAQSVWNFKASHDVPKEQQQTLRADVVNFAKMPFIINDEAFDKVLGTKGPVRAADLIAWLSLRARYIVGEGYQMNEQDTYVVKDPYSFQFPGVYPEIPKSLSPSDSKEVVTVMSNLGAALYLGGKMSGMLIGINVPGIGKLPVSSPRVGLLKIGRGLFKLGRTKEATSGLDSSLLRVAVLFHEARHSDGQKKHVGFTHAVCPTGHAYAGYAACDFNLNGPYSVGFQIGKALAENCPTCTVGQREALRLDYLDSYSRVITSQDAVAGNPQDLATLKTLKDSCDTFLKIAPDNPEFKKMCAGVAEKLARAGARSAAKAQYLDATPEGKL